MKHSSDQKMHNQMVIASLMENPGLVFDKLWRMNNLYWIITKDMKKEVFQMNKAQRHFFDNYLNVKDPYLRHVILKSRQLGFTTFIDIWMLDEILFNKDREAIIIAHLQKEAVEIFDRKIDFPLRNMCTELKESLFEIARNSARKIQVKFNDLENGETGDDQSKSAISVSLSGRSGTFHYAHISEYAPMCVQFPKRASEVKLGTFPAVPKEGYIFIESTAETMADDFHAMFKAEWYRRDTIEPADTQYRFMPHFYNWTWDTNEIGKIRKIIKIEDMEACPEIDWRIYQEDHGLTDLEMTYYYMQWEQLGRDVRKLNQQYPTIPEEAFLASGQTYFPTRRVSELWQKTHKGKRYDIFNGTVEENHYGDLEIFKHPEKNVGYIIGGDTSQGTSDGDAQVMVVINRVTEEIVALYKSNVSADEYPDIAIGLAKYYNNAVLAIEVNGEGRWINAAIVASGYGNVYYREAFDDVTKTMSKNYGFLTNRQSRITALMSLKAIILRKEERHFPSALLEEMEAFVMNAKGHPAALSGKHDDVIMASAIGYAVLFQYGKQTNIAQEQQEKSLMQLIFNED